MIPGSPWEISDWDAREWLCKEAKEGHSGERSIDIGQDSRHKGAWGFPNLKEPAVVIVHMCGTGKGGRSGSRDIGGDNVAISHSAQDPNATQITSSNID